MAFQNSHVAPQRRTNESHVLYYTKAEIDALIATITSEHNRNEDYARTRLNQLTNENNNLRSRVRELEDKIDDLYERIEELESDWEEEDPTQHENNGRWRGRWTSERVRVIRRGGNNDYEEYGDDSGFYDAEDDSRSRGPNPYRRKCVRCLVQGHHWYDCQNNCVHCRAGIFAHHLQPCPLRPDIWPMWSGGMTVAEARQSADEAWRARNRQ